MRRTWLVIGICGVSVMLAAEPVCKRLIWHVPLPHRPAKKLDHKPTARTIARWRAWDEATTLREYDLACEPVATLDASPTTLVKDVETPAVAMLDLPVGLIDAAPVPEYTVAEVSVGSEPVLPWISPPLYLVPEIPQALTQTPEPGPLWLVLLGLTVLLVKRRAIPTYSQVDAK